MEAGYRGAKAIRKTQSKMVEATVQLGGDITKESEQIEALNGGARKRVQDSLY